MTTKQAPYGDYGVNDADLTILNNALSAAEQAAVGRILRSFRRLFDAAGVARPGGEARLGGFPDGDRIDPALKDQIMAELDHIASGIIRG